MSEPIRERFADCWARVEQWLASDAPPGSPSTEEMLADDAREGRVLYVVINGPDEDPAVDVYDREDLADLLSPTERLMLPHDGKARAIAWGEPDYGFGGRFQVREIGLDGALGPIREPVSVKREDRLLSHEESYAIGWESVFAALNRLAPGDRKRLAAAGAVVVPILGPYASEEDRIACVMSWADFTVAFPGLVESVRPDGTLRLVSCAELFWPKEWQVRRMQLDGTVGDIERYSRPISPIASAS